MTTTAPDYVITGPSGRATRHRQTRWVDVVDPLALVVAEWTLQPVEHGEAETTLTVLRRIAWDPVAPTGSYSMALWTVDELALDTLRDLRMPRALAARLIVTRAIPVNNRDDAYHAGRSLVRLAVNGDLPLTHPQLALHHAMWTAAVDLGDLLARSAA